MLDRKSRINRAHKIIAILKDYLGTDLRKRKLLDVGTGVGYITHEFTKEIDDVSSVDIVDERREKRGYDFKVVDSVELPYDDGVFDIVVSNHVVEHVPAQEQHISEIFRVLRPGGVLYLATPNRFWLLDPHYLLPVISWIPRQITAFLFRIFGKKWDIFPLSLFRVNKLLREFGKTAHYSTNILKNPEKYNLPTNLLTKLVRALPSSLLSLLLFWHPTFIVVASKKK